MEGFYFGNWTTNPNQGGPDDNDYTVNNKPTARIVRDWYGRSGIGERDITFSPNPSRNRTYFSMRYSTPNELKIYDLKWSLGAKKTINQRSEKLVLKNLPTGVYIDRVGNSSFKLIQIK